MIGDERDRVPQEAGAGRTSFIVEHLGVGQPGVIIGGQMDVVLTQRTAADAICWAARLIEKADGKSRPVTAPCNLSFAGSDVVV